MADPSTRDARPSSGMWPSPTGDGTRGVVRGAERPEPLWREVTGRILRRRRHDVGERLVETARRAGVSSQYLSEIERGRKDASSEVLAAVSGALGLTLADLTAEAGRELSRHAVTPVLLGAGTRMMAPSTTTRRGPLALAA